MTGRSKARTLREWFGVGLIVAGMLALKPLHVSIISPGAAAVLLGFGALLVLSQRDQVALAMLAATLVSAFLGDALYSAHEAAIVPTSEVLVRLIAYCIAPLFDAVGVVRDRLLVVEERQLTEFIASASLVGSREVLVTLFVLASQAAAMRLRVEAGDLVILVLGVLATVAMRTTLGLVQYIQASNLDDSHLALVHMWGPGLFLMTILGIVTLFGLRIQTPRRLAAPLEVGRTWRFWLVAAASGAALAGVIGFGLTLRVSTRTGAGRVLIDDRLSGFWEPAGRLLDRDRYGDFSTYSFATLVETLARRYSVSINICEPYTEELLAQNDVLILKTPRVPLEPEEVQAIQSWTRKGGGLFVVGDHTDLTGMNTFLNEIVRGLGVWFRNDSVTTVDIPGFVFWEDELLSSHPISAGMAGFGMMTGCSITGDWAVEPVLPVRRVGTVRGDYGSASNFGSIPPQLDGQQGTTLAAAAKRVGKGRLLAFSDSTVFSSFALFIDSHTDFLERGVAWLNAGDEPLWPRVLAGLLGVCVVILGVRRLPVDPTAGLVLVAFFLSGAAAGMIAGTKVSGELLFVPEPWTAVQRVALVAEGGAAILPPVLGEQPTTRSDENFMTFAQVPLRLGMEVAVIPRDPKRLDEFDAVIVINPDSEHDESGIPPEWITGLEAWVKEGGRLIVLTQGAHHACEHVRDAAYRLEGRYEARPAQEGSIGTESAALGSGTVTFASPSEYWSVEEMGHCMALPSSRQREHYESAYQLFTSMGLGQTEEQRRVYFPTTSSARKSMRRVLEASTSSNSSRVL